VGDLDTTEMGFRVQMVEAALRTGSTLAGFINSMAGQMEI
jgi:hypothetical protein